MDAFSRLSLDDGGISVPTLQGLSLHSEVREQEPEHHTATHNQYSDRTDSDVDMTGEYTVPPSTREYCTQEQGTQTQTQGDGDYTTGTQGEDNDARPSAAAHLPPRVVARPDPHPDTDPDTDYRPAEPHPPRLQINNFYWGGGETAQPPSTLDSVEYSDSPDYAPGSFHSPRGARGPLPYLSLSTLLVAYALHIAHKDLVALWRADLSAMQHESLQCAQQFEANRCATQPLPALQALCAQWSQCMQRDNGAVYGTRLLRVARLAGEALQAFALPLGWKALVLVVGVAALFWVARGVGESEPARLPRKDKSAVPCGERALTVAATG